LLPMASAIAAGNTVAGKPSELAPATSAAVARLIPRYLDPDAVAIVEGGVEEATALLEERFDHIFYTGSARVGHVVMEAAARHLTPVTLELGGKSPAISFLNQRPKPLSLYFFTSQGQVAEQVLARTSSGSACVNTCIVQLAVPGLPFGGVGQSGMGAYHGRRGFETFSHSKAVMVKP